MTSLHEIYIIVDVLWIIQGHEQGERQDREDPVLESVLFPSPNVGTEVVSDHRDCPQRLWVFKVSGCLGGRRYVGRQLSSDTVLPLARRFHQTRWMAKRM